MFRLVCGLLLVRYALPLPERAFRITQMLPPRRDAGRFGQIALLDAGHRSLPPLIPAIAGAQMTKSNAISERAIIT